MTARTLPGGSLLRLVLLVALFASLGALNVVSAAPDHPQADPQPLAKGDDQDDDD